MNQSEYEGDVDRNRDGSIMCMLINRTEYEGDVDIHRDGRIMCMLIKQSEYEGDDWTNTVNLEIFARIVFSRNVAYEKFRESKILAKWLNHSVDY